jgi:hypothetical protein
VGALAAAVSRALHDVGVAQCHWRRMCLGLFSLEGKRFPAIGDKLPEGWDRCHFPGARIEKSG